MKVLQSLFLFLFFLGITLPAFGQQIEEATLNRDASPRDTSVMANGEEDVDKIADEMPLFAGCEDIKDKEKQKQCAQRKMLEFIYQNIHYPTLARENGVEGMVVIRFIVEKDGQLSNTTIIRDVGAGLGEEALRVVNMMPPFIPGKQKGEPVRVYFNIPVKFKLEKPKSKKKFRW